ncbi:MAG TPA: response regulator, partial [Anaerolineae bacterium]|nr:response regulator [Anaerolineae bacterium]
MANQKILIVDDEKNIRLTMKQALQPLGYELETAVNGEDALQQLEVGDFGLILLDLRLPGLSGLEVLRRVAELRPDIRVILISAHGTVENAVEAMRLGAVDFIQKPFVP